MKEFPIRIGTGAYSNRTLSLQRPTFEPPARVQTDSILVSDVHSLVEITVPILLGHLYETPHANISSTIVGPSFSFRIP